MQELIQEQEESQGVPICGANLSTPVTDITSYIQEIHYKIGEHLFLENAD